MFFDENKKEVPGFEEMLKPVLLALQNKGGKANIADLDKEAITIMNLSDEVVQIMHKKYGKQSEVSYRMAWARTYLKKYGLIQNADRGIWSFTDKFNGDIERISVNEIVNKVRNGGTLEGQEELIFTGIDSRTAFEKMVGALLMDLAEKEKKQAYYTYSADCEYDIILPTGLEEINEELKCIIFVVDKQGENASVFIDELKEKYSFLEKEKYLILTNVLVSEKAREKVGKNIIIWDKNDLMERVNPEAPYAQYLFNPKKALIEDIVASNSSDAIKKEERASYIKRVKAAFRRQDMVLFLGAGVSLSGGIPLWETLIKKLHINMLKELTEDKSLSFIEQEMINELALDNKMESPLLQMRYIKSAFSNDEYFRLVHAALYSEKIQSDTELLNAITRICTPQRNYCGIKSIITYNFDNLLEMNLAQKDISYNIISCEKDRQMVEKLNIYHVHGYLPKDFHNISNESELIFSEEDYHKVYRDSYSWSNLAQLNALRESTCLFIGCSLKDPNLRRLLDVASRREESPRHFAFLVKEEKKNIKGSMNKDILKIYQKLDDNIRKAYYSELGLNIIWIEDYKEIPDILNSFLE